MSHHTPGPWYIAADGYSVYNDYSDLDKRPTAIAVTTDSTPFAPPDDEAKANAKLIAAAPELLADLHMVVANLPVHEATCTCRSCCVRAAAELTIRRLDT
ncbi:MAG TPA: hypothetical protein VNA25_30005 [Phycisphaerae bacterium]|nr:hypothetical protein [Phycisphaerae bacterium]